MATALRLTEAAPGAAALRDPREESCDAEPVLDGAPLGRRLAGRRLEAALRTEDGGWLLFAVDDEPFEEVLQLHLLGPGGAALDRASLGAPGATGWFRDLALEEEGRRARFRFIGGTPWRATVLARPELRLPLPFRSGVWRAPRLRRRLRLEGAPRPER